MKQESPFPERYAGTITLHHAPAEPTGSLLAPDAGTTPRTAAGQSHAVLRGMQYVNLPTPIYCWSVDGRDLLLLDFNDAANDLTYGYIGDLLGQSARVIFQQHPEVITDLERCAWEHSLIVRRGALYHPGLPTALPGVARYCFAPPGLVIVQVDVESPREFHE